MKIYIPPASPFKKSLRNSIKEGVTAEVVIRVLDYYLIPFALFLGAQDKYIGLLVATPNLISSLALFSTPFVVFKLRSRLKTVTRCIGSQCLILIPFVFLPFISFPANVVILIALVTIFRSLGTIIGPPWGSLVSDYLPVDKRGRYFGSRSQIVGLAGITTGVLAGILLSVLKQVSEQLSFIIIFLLAAVSRCGSYLLTKKMIDIDGKLIREFSFSKSYHTFIAHFKNRNFARFTLYVAGTTFATQMAYPFLSVWMLKGMHLNYMWYTSVHLASTIAGIIAFPAWGRHIDILGSVSIQKRVSWFIATIPLLWIMARQFPLGLVLAEVYSGLIWAGFNLSTSNFIYNSCSSEERVNCLIFYNFINGTAAFLGASTGGFLLNILPGLFHSPILSLFVISSVLRLLADLFIARHFTEIRKDIRQSTVRELLFSMLGFNPLTGRTNEWDTETTA
ncbi:MAG: MFS transporter [Candidatus Omnitrophota bacterium]